MIKSIFIKLLIKLIYLLLDKRLKSFFYQMLGKWYSPTPDTPLLFLVKSVLLDELRVTPFFTFLFGEKSEIKEGSNIGNLLIDGTIIVESFGMRKSSLD